MRTKTALLWQILITNSTSIIFSVPKITIRSSSLNSKIVYTNTSPKLAANRDTRLAAGGMADHLHLLVSLSPMVSVSKTIQTIKGSSSKWINDCYYPEQRQFKWQSGYGAFSTGRLRVEKLRIYIKNQKIHHGQMTFKEEYRKLLKKYGINWDEKYIWG